MLSYKISKTRRVFYVIRLFCFGCFYTLIGQKSSLDIIYNKIRYIVKIKIKEYNNIDVLDIEETMDTINSLQQRFIKNLNNLDIDIQTKKSILEFFEDWSNIFLQIELIKLKLKIISEKQFIDNIINIMQNRMVQLKSKLMAISNTDSKKIILLCDLAIFLGEVGKNFQSLEEIFSFIVKTIETFGSINDFIYVMSNIFGEAKKEEVQCCTL